MSTHYIQLLALLLASTGSVVAVDIPFVFYGNYLSLANYTASQLIEISSSSSDIAGVSPVTLPVENEILKFSVTGGGNTPGAITEKNVGDLKKAIELRVEPDNRTVHDTAVVLAAKFPGDYTIDQICSVYNYLRNGDNSIRGWSYVPDPRGIDYFSYASESLKNGEKSNCAGAGDCDDFAILMSALVESIGGTTRIILAHNNSTGGHAYAEVYLGRLGAQNSQVGDILIWMKKKFSTDKIYLHVDTDTRNIWLNLDWSADHPGGPFYKGDKHVVLCIRDYFEKTPLNLPSSSKEKVAEQKNKSTSLNISRKSQIRILFDESHHQFWTACADSALIDYANELRKSGYKVDTLIDGPIKFSVLKGYDILAFPNGFVGKNNLDEGVKLLSDDEIDAITQFVQEGGGLALFECGWSWPRYSGLSIDKAPINQLGNIFGITLNDDIIHDPTNHYPGFDDSCPIFYKPYIRDHPVTRDVQTISNCEGIPSSLTIKNPEAEILISGDDDSYSGKYGSGQKPPFMAIVAYGKGKVIVFGQVGFLTSLDGNKNNIKNLSEYDNKKLGLNIMEWLSA
jgi:hypothetical protein